MHISQFAARLLEARKARGLTQAELARRAQVSTRLVAEVERGERSNVSLATALRLCSEAGLTVALTGPTTEESQHRESARQSGRLARAAARRATWGGQQIRLSEKGREDPGAWPALGQ